MIADIENKIQKFAKRIIIKKLSEIKLSDLDFENEIEKKMFKNVIVNLKKYVRKPRFSLTRK